MSNSPAIIQTAIYLLLLYTVPLCLFIGAYYVARRVSRIWAKATIGTVGLAALAAFLFIVINLTPYLWACYLESKWSSADPQTREEMESFLSLYTAKEIQPHESGWGKNHLMRDGDKMIQYMILWNAPLEIVYDRENKLVATYTSYE